MSSTQVLEWRKRISEGQEEVEDHKHAERPT